MRRPAVATKQRVDFLVRNAREYRRIVDLVAVQVQYRQHRAVAHRVQELVRVPCGCERAGLGFAVADDDGHEQVWIVEGRSERVRHAVAEFAALMDRSRRFGRAVTADAAWKRELLEELPQAFAVFALVGVDLGVGALEVHRSQDAGRAVSRSGEKDRVEVVLPDQAIHVHVGEAEAGARAPVAEQPALDVLRPQGFAQQRVVEQIDHARCKVIAGAPVRVDLPQFRRCARVVPARGRASCFLRHVIPSLLECARHRPAESHSCQAQALIRCNQTRGNISAIEFRERRSWSLRRSAGKRGGEMRWQAH